MTAWTMSYVVFPTQLTASLLHMNHTVDGMILKHGMTWG